MKENNKEDNNIKLKERTPNKEQYQKILEQTHKITEILTIQIQRLINTVPDNHLTQDEYMELQTSLKIVESLSGFITSQIIRLSGEDIQEILEGMLEDLKQYKQETSGDGNNE